MDESKKRRTSVRLTDELVERLADHEGVHKSDTVRRALRANLG